MRRRRSCRPCAELTANSAALSRSIANTILLADVVTNLFTIADADVAAHTIANAAADAAPDAAPIAAAVTAADPTPVTDADKHADICADTGAYDGRANSVPVEGDLR